MFCYISELKQKQSDLKNKQEEILFKICKEISSVFEKNLLFLKFLNKEFDRFDHYQARLFFAKNGDKNFILPSKKDVNKLVDFCHPALHNPKPITIDFTKFTASLIFSFNMFRSSNPSAECCISILLICNPSLIILS